MNPSASVTRREVLRIGAVSIFGGMALATKQAQAAQESRPQKNCIFMMLQGGASHHDLWDPKPETSSDIRGPFETIATSDPSVRFGELLQGTAKQFEHIAVIRSMTHKFTNHIAGTYIAQTGSTNQQDRDREAHPNDFPGPAAALNYLQKSAPSVPRSVSLPTWLSIPGPSNRMPGQYGGFIGAVDDPFLIEGDPNSEKYNPLSLKMTGGMSSPRMNTRLSLLKQLDSTAWALEEELQERNDHLIQSALEMVTDGRVRKALDLSQETDAVRDQYGRNKLGQSILLARRLIEAGVQYVGYNEFNQKWDTHGGLQNRYKQIVPPMEQAFSALVADLHQRGMLEDTLVINTGEFGRTPKMNTGGGRDHWPNVYSMALAGGKIRGGQVLGASDKVGGEVADHPVSPADVLATMWDHLGIHPRTEIYDRLNRPFLLSSGKVLHELM